MVVQAGEIALKFEPDRAHQVIQLVGPRLVEIGRCSAVSLYYNLSNVLDTKVLAAEILR